MRPVTVRVPAKINPHLSVGDQRGDGYHDLTTVYHAVSLFDTVTASPADHLSVAVPGATGVPAGPGNLAHRAAALLAERAGVEPAVRLTIDKSIPVAGGLAGGSADAAGALVACDALWGTGLSRVELAELAAELGSDIPFSLLGGTALGTGRGEKLEPVTDAGDWCWVLGTFTEGLSTPAAYAELDRLRAGGHPDRAGSPDPLLSVLRTGDPARLGPLLRNDLQAAAFSVRPELANVLAAGVDAGAFGAVVSGSGPTCVFLVPPDRADAIGRALPCAYRVAHGPVAGATVI